MVFQNFESADGTYYSREQLPENAYSRVEQYLRELCLLEGSPLPVPQTRIEKLLNCLVTGKSDFEEPRSRIEGLIYALITGDESNIETCASRVEVLWYMLVKGLDAEALLGTNVNGKVVEDCFSRVESYLWNLLHNGGFGDSILYELNNQVTMYNTIAKSVNDGTLLGNTMVNIVGDNVIIEGEVTGTESFEYDEDFTIESASLKGQTLVNLMQELNNRTPGTTIETQDDYIVHTVILEGDWYQLVTPNSGMVKPSTQYLLVIDVVENTLSTPMHITGNSEYGKFIDTSDAIQPNTTGVFKFKLTSKSAFTLTEQTNDLFLQYGREEIVGNKIKLRAMLIEYQDGMENWDIPYFEGMTSVKMPVLTTSNCPCVFGKGGRL